MELRKNDPEFAERFQHFAFDEVVNEENQQLDAPTRYLAILSVLIGCGGVDAYRTGKRYDAGYGKGNGLSGYGLSGLRKNASLPQCNQRGFC